MRTARFVRRLSHPPQEVSAFLSDLRNDPKWRPEVLRVELLSGTPGEAGAHYVEWVTWEGIQAETTLSVTEMVPGARLVLVAKDPGFDSSFDYAFTDYKGQCELRLTMSLETTGPLRLIEPFMWSLVSRWVEGSLDHLDTVLDQLAATPAQTHPSPQPASH